MPEPWKPSFWFKLYFLPQATSLLLHNLLTLALWKLTASYSNPQVFRTEKDACNSSLGHLRVHFHLSRFPIVRVLTSHRTPSSKQCFQRRIQWACLCLYLRKAHAVCECWNWALVKALFPASQEESILDWNWPPKHNGAFLLLQSTNSLSIVLFSSMASISCDILQGSDTAYHVMCNLETWALGSSCTVCLGKGGRFLLKVTWVTLWVNPFNSFLSLIPELSETGKLLTTLCSRVISESVFTQPGELSFRALKRPRTPCLNHGFYRIVCPICVFAVSESCCVSTWKTELLLTAFLLPWVSYLKDALVDFCFNHNNFLV